MEAEEYCHGSCYRASTPQFGVEKQGKAGGDQFVVEDLLDLSKQDEDDTGMEASEGGGLDAPNEITSTESSTVTTVDSCSNSVNGGPESYFSSELGCRSLGDAGLSGNFVSRTRSLRSWNGSPISWRNPFQAKISSSLISSPRPKAKIPHPLRLLVPARSPTANRHSSARRRQSPEKPGASGPVWLPVTGRRVCCCCHPRRQPCRLIRRPPWYRRSQAKSWQKRRILRWQHRTGGNACTVLPTRHRSGGRGPWDRKHSATPVAYVTNPVDSCRSTGRRRVPPLFYRNTPTPIERSSSFADRRSFISSTSSTTGLSPSPVSMTGPLLLLQHRPSTTDFFRRLSLLLSFLILQIYFNSPSNFPIFFYFITYNRVNF
ncbi:hypothetical protein HPP92_008877 [Vanilla planifolia]|uniref:Uncharacterized protein n=1 Tax=Vanilla planifolia TaxID=51239 RepID=A0A835RIM2_VANPL|nr:hypothetical protein HPP92_008877 [Vanilla planifolia]